MTFTDDGDIIDMFTNGQCASLAYEIHKLTDWTIAILSDCPVGSPEYMAHVFILDSDGYAIDIKGKRTLNEIRQEWGFCSHLHRFWDLKEFEYEMLDWQMSPRYDRDKEAKFWANEIVNMLR